MSLDTVAEYVETDEIRDRIAQHGVDYAQGYAVGRAESFEDLLRQLPQLNGGAPALGTIAAELSTALALNVG
jgi:EAL domain-containing protein (putative c-di-GMP-specific phosphodiesterase class I)